MNSLSVILTVLGITTPIFILVILGLWSVRRGHFPAEGVPALARFMTHYALPAALFSVLATQDFETLFNPGFFWAYGVGSCLTIALLLVWFRLRRASATDAGLSILGGTMCNCMIVGLPVTLVLFGPREAAVMGMVSFFQDIFILPLGMLIADIGQGRDWRKTLLTTFAKFARNPVFIAIVAGVAVAAVGVTIPAPLFRAVELMAASISATGLFMIGGLLAFQSLHGLVGRIAPVVLTKLVLHPALVLLAFLVFPIADVSFAQTAVLAASLPMVGLYAAVATGYEQGEDAAAATLVGTLGACLTIAAVMATAFSLIV